MSVGQPLGATAVTIRRSVHARARRRARRLVPRAFALVWVYVAYVGVMAMFGELLPDGLDAASPFTYLPALPAEQISWAPVLACTVVGVASGVVGVVAFRRRDLQG